MDEAERQQAIEHRKLLVKCLKYPHFMHPKRRFGVFLSGPSQYNNQGRP
jgi:hypothetical protein